MARPKKLITPKPLPSPTGGVRTNEYVMALDQFLAADCESALVNIAKKPATVRQALGKTIKSDTKYSKVKVALRGTEVYLTRT